MKKLYLELTSRCNLDCSICYRRSWTDAPADMDEATVAALLTQAASSETLRSVVLGGMGEPSASPRFLRALGALGGRPGRELIVTSNGLGYDESMVAAVAGSVDLLAVSIDGLESGYRRIRGAELGEAVSTMRRVGEERRRLGLAGSNLGLHFVLSRDNASEALGVLELAASLRARSMTVSHLLAQSEEQAAGAMYGRIAPPEARRLFDALRSRALRLGLSLTLPRLELKTERPCPFIEDEAMVVTADGLAAPCYRLAHSYPEYFLGRRKAVLAYGFGDATSESLASIWNAGAYRAFRAVIYSGRYPSCPDCDLVDGCDLVRDTSADCHSGSPSCADCPWARGFTLCP